MTSAHNGVVTLAAQLDVQVRIYMYVCTMQSFISHGHAHAYLASGQSWSSASSLAIRHLSLCIWRKFEV